MNVIINLYLSFFKIGLFGFGGGYAMISLIQQELTQNGWLKLNEFVDIIAIAQMTPGPIAINSATFVGFKTSGIFTAFITTVGVVTPSFILVLTLAYFYEKINDSDFMLLVMKYLRVTVIGLILIAAFGIARNESFNMINSIIFLVVFLVMVKTDINPILVILLSGLTGILIF
ncbi:MAG: chromate transporter [Bacillota bacterium]